MLPSVISLLYLLQLVSSLPHAPSILSPRGDVVEWTALGDSYASGVGSGEYGANSYRCLRYDQAYPVQLNGADLELGDNWKFNNVVCSGSSSADVEAYQFYDKDTSGQPNRQYGKLNLILLPSLSKKRTCDDQRAFSWNLINAPKLVDDIDHLIQMTVTRGRKGTVGDKFKLYVAGFGEFFNWDDPACDTVTFARSANPVDDGKDHVKMTSAIRQDFNAMSRGLNAAIKAAVDRNSANGVKFIDIQQGGPGLDTHRFCEKDANEPNQNNPKLWFWHYPYNEPEDPTVDKVLSDAYAKTTPGMSADDINKKWPMQNDLFEAVLANVDPGAEGLLDPIWRAAGNRFKVFHPQPAFHTVIKDLILAEWKADRDVDSAPPTPPAGQDKVQCHGINGDVWIMHRDTAAQNIKDFCAQASKSVEYNDGTVDQLRLSVDFPSDESQGTDKAPDCAGRITRAILDGCDGNDPINNPHNYKFGGTFTSADGWVYKLEALSQQVNDLSCDVSYKFVYDGFEIRGKNWPDATFGANGEGLKKQLDGCGAVTDWGFEWTPNDVKFQWYAHGHLPIGTKACVGRAAKSAGASGDGNCHGAGKRSVEW
ncbi:uncharacterized protein BDZ99DRAFT_444813 [Mytilinidion resinicola]|uniref:SGNH hydrolase n=1 Tax=Mytilinidion resinicola TaxID=574789 RepID=A0A6A6YM37_9PEZI|nr:uncharacterized protein BDZ99DRAFT_444813 [Mytilinidion resinicola]KAF2808927.1 hypothetical protein BDZ99DRAFT_444813 [Mytilinidion resinicola]